MLNLTMERRIIVQRVLRVVALVIACITRISIGSVVLFNAYQNPFKATYNYTQSEAALVASMSTIGLGTVFIPGILYDKFGPTVTSFCGLIISTGGYLLIWSTTKYVTFYKDKAWLTGIYFLIGGHGCNFGYMSSLNTSIKNVSGRYLGRVCGLMSGSFAIGPTFYTFVYYQFYVQEPQTIDSNHDYPGFIFLTAVSLGATHLLCVIFLRVYEPECSLGAANGVCDINELSSNRLTKKGSYDLETVDSANAMEISAVSLNNGTEFTENPPSPTSETIKEKSFFALIKNINFQLFVWVYGISCAVGIVFSINITTTTKSVSLTEYDTWVVLIAPLVDIVASFSVGILMDRLKKRWPTRYFLICRNIICIISGIMYTIKSDELIVLIVATAINGLGQAVGWTTAPAYLTEMYGQTQFGRNWGIVLMISAALGAALQPLFATLYELRLKADETVVCYGFDCVQSSYGAMLAFLVLALILNIILNAREVRSVK